MNLSPKVLGTFIFQDGTITTMIIDTITNRAFVPKSSIQKLSTVKTNMIYFDVEYVNFSEYLELLFSERKQGKCIKIKEERELGLVSDIYRLYTKKLDTGQQQLINSYYLEEGQDIGQFLMEAPASILKEVYNHIIFMPPIFGRIPL